jgi:hypothetical protein
MGGSDNLPEWCSSLSENHAADCQRIERSDEKCYGQAAQLPGATAAEAGADASHQARGAATALFDYVFNAAH